MHLTNTCWSCGVLTGHVLIEARTDSDDDGEYRVQGAFYCLSCNAMSTGTVEVYHTYDDFRVDAFKDVDNEIIWHPTANSTRAYPDVPEHIASPATEAFECCAAGHLRAAIILARAVIEATAKDKDITTGQLHTKIDALANQGFIRAHIKEAAHEIRNVGNDMAHGDFDDPITRPTADLVIALMEEILNEVYQSPAKVKKLQAARAAANATR